MRTAVRPQPLALISTSTCRPFEFRCKEVCRLAIRRAGPGPSVRTTVQGSGPRRQNGTGHAWCASSHRVHSRNASGPPQLQLPSPDKQFMTPKPGSSLCKTGARVGPDRARDRCVSHTRWLNFRRFEVRPGPAHVSRDIRLKVASFHSP
jgi:hypothetical protein